jgi:PAS domain S-box-containing protein
MTTLETDSGLGDLLLAVLEQWPDAVTVFTADESLLASRIVYANRAQIELSGYSYETLVGHSALLLAGARPDLDGVEPGALETHRRPFFASARKHRPDGSTYEVEMYVTSLRDAAGEVTHHVLTQREVGIRRRLEAFHTARTVGVERSSAMASLAAGAAFELGPPASRLLARVEEALLAVGTLEEKDGPSPLRRSLLDARACAESIVATARAMVAFTMPEDSGIVPTDVRDAIELALRLTACETGPRARIVRSYGATAPVYAATAELARVFAALLRNAAEAIPPETPFGNTITVTTRQGEDGDVTVLIADTGVGIEARDLPYVYDPFFTTKPSGSVGLGLSLARAVVLKAGGDIWVESILGRGTVFRVSLPAEALPETPGCTLPRAVETPPTRRILCVGSSRVEAFRLGQLFDEESNLLSFALEEEGLERIALGEPFDLIVYADSSESDLRARIRDVAPAVLGRTLCLALPVEASGLYPSTQVLLQANEK